MNQKRKVAIITGGSQGIGRAVAELLGATGAAVLINYVGDDAPAAETIKAIETRGGVAAAFNGDISKVANISRMFDKCEELFGSPDIFVANAGTGVPPKPLEEISEDDYYFTFDVNVKGTLFCLKEAKKRLNDGGRIVVTSSSSVKYPVDGLAVYIASKAALISLVEASVNELAQRGITINSVLPGLTETPMIQDHPEEFKKEVAAASPFKRLGQPEDVAEAIVFLTEERARWISGQHILANGGSKF
ncbi:MAG: 3-ketoacyl-ACP reductase [Firmicutes bacterium]|nr:3-ketoacyl-ACP reductase [Bacillota bacterium]